MPRRFDFSDQALRKFPGGPSGVSRSTEDPSLREAEQHHALSRRSKRKLVGFTFVVVTLMLVTTSPSPVLVLVVILALTASLTGIARMSKIEEEWAPARLAALPAT